MLRHYYISDDLDDLELIEAQLRDSGFTTPQFHVLSEQDAEVEKHHLHAIEPILKKDLVHSSQIGAFIGLGLSALLMAFVWSFEWYQSAAGWFPWAFICLAILGFCVWEGGLIGIQLPHHQFKRFQKTLKDGYHIFFVDVDPEQEAALAEIIPKHPRLKLAGTGEATPTWVVRTLDKFHRDHSPA